MNSILSHIRRSLSLKLSFGILLLAILIFVTSLGVLFMQSRYNIKNVAKERAVSVLNTTMQRVTRYLETVEVATEVNEWLVRERMHPDSLLAFSARIVLFNGNVSGCSITTEPNFFPQYGRYFSAYTIRQGDSLVTVREEEYEYFEKGWYATPRRLGRACWIDPFYDSNEGTLSAKDMIASYCKPLYADDGRLMGVIATDLSLKQLSAVINTEKPYPNAYFVMLGEDGHYYVHPDTTLLVNHTIFGGDGESMSTELIALGHEMTAGETGQSEVTVRGKRCIVSYSRVPGTRWSLALVCPEGDVLKGYYSLTYVILPLLAVGLLLILLFCRSIVAHAIRPISRLLEQSQQIADGSCEERIPHTGREDAVGQLQNSFATMQESLDRHIGDIEQMNAEDERRNKELAEANRLAEEAGRQKTAFIQDVTHQIRTPLNIIMGFAQVFRDSGADMTAEDAVSITDMMKHNVMTLSRMVLMLYDSSDTGTSEEMKCERRDQVPVNQLSRDCIEHTYLHFPRLHVTFDTCVPDSLTIQTNWLYLMRSIRELLYNAAKYSDGENVKLTVSETADRVLFTFEDTGTGIAEEYRELMFEPFTKVNELSEGLGLGLPLSKRHFRNLGGDLVYDSSYTVGCRLIAELPKDN